jgi:hypothetical protein
MCLIQPIHPPDVPASVTTAQWAIVHYLGVAMCLFGLLGLAGFYARQEWKRPVGWVWPATLCSASSTR